MGEVKLFLELAEKMLTVLTKVSFLLGMAILLVYCARYGGIPDGVSVGDSLRIFLAVTVFSVGTLVVYFFLMCLGISMWSLMFWLSRFKRAKRYFFYLRMQVRAIARKNTRFWHGPSEFYRNYKRHRSFLYHFTSPVFTPMLHLLSVLTIMAMGLYIHEDYVFWYFKFTISAFLLGSWYFLITFNSLRDAQMDLVFSDVKTITKLRTEIRLSNAFYTVIVFLFVTLSLGLFNSTANQTMRLLGIRHDNATVYVRETWSKVLASHGIKGIESPLESYKSRYDNVTVALSSFGSSVSLEFHTEGESQTLRIPATEVLIDPLTSKQK